MVWGMQNFLEGYATDSPSIPKLFNLRRNSRCYAKSYLFKRGTVFEKPSYKLLPTSIHLEDVNLLLESNHLIFTIVVI